jgi:hypothetical protein
MVLEDVAEGDVIVDYDDFLDIIECVGSTVLHAGVALSDRLPPLSWERGPGSPPGEVSAAGISAYYS